MKKNIQSQFTEAKKSITLSQSEKAFHRTKVESFIHTRPLPHATPSPSWMWSAVSLRVSTFAVALLVVAGGTTVAAEKTLPGDTLYSLKVNVTERVRSSLITSPQKRAMFETGLVSRRLDELAQVTASNKNLSTNDSASFNASLQTHLEAAQEAIQDLQETGDVGGALESNSDLASTLDAHAEIFENIQKAYPESTAENANTTTQVDNALRDADEIAVQIKSTIASTTDTIRIETTLKRQRATALTGMEALKVIVLDPPVSLDEADLLAISDDLIRIETLLTEAIEKETIADTKSALILFTEANQEIDTVRALIIADEHLGIDIVGNEETNSPEEVSE